MARRLLILLALAASTLALGASAAYASSSDEVNAGKAIAAKVDAGTVGCQDLNATDFEHLGEYVMERMVGSSSVHEAMNARMDAIMGSENADRMHQALGRRYAGCGAGAGAPAGAGAASGMMGGGMMGGGSTGGWGAMMGSGYAWMRNGTWQHMTRADWQRAGNYMMGGGWMMNTGGGWSTGAVIGVVLGALALGGLAVYLVLRRPWHHGPTRTSTA